MARAAGEVGHGVVLALAVRPPVVRASGVTSPLQGGVLLAKARLVGRARTRQGNTRVKTNTRRRKHLIPLIPIVKSPPHRGILLGNEHCGVVRGRDKVTEGGRIHMPKVITSRSLYSYSKE